MELTGKLLELIVSKNTSFEVKDCRKLVFKNIGQSVVKVGLYTLLPNEERVYHDSNVTVDVDVPINFSSIDFEPRLHVSQVVVTGAICRN